LRALGAVILGCVLALLLAEGSLRAYLALAPDPPGSPYVRDAHAVYRLRPEAILPDSSNCDDHINALGFRDREHAAKKPADTFRVLGIGDSFVYGAVPVAQNFLRIAENTMARALGDSARVEMVMMGLGGYSTSNELGVLESVGLALAPDLVVLCFFVGNDVTGIPVRGEVIGGRLYYVGSNRWWRHALRKSRLYVLAEMFYVVQVKSPLMRANAAAVPMAKGLAPNGPVPPVTRAYADIESRNLPVYHREPSRSSRALWSEAERQLKLFDTRCHAAGVPWILMIVPEEIQVDPEVRVEVLQALHASPDAYDFDLPQRRLAVLARARGISVVDPLPRMRSVHRPDARLYVPNDTHWNERGNRIAGEILGEHLARQHRRSNRALGAAPHRRP